MTEATLADMRAKFPTRILEEAVKGMIPRNKLAAERLSRLRIFVGENHTHTAQTPEKVEVK
jgi:large subunit ribosomal protein L13